MLTSSNIWLVLVLVFGLIIRWHLGHQFKILKNSKLKSKPRIGGINL
jgi:hypothetical protein